MSIIHAPATLDKKDRCCGRKPLVYKRPKPELYCPRCDRSYDPATKRQVSNWAWREYDTGFAWTSRGKWAS